MIQTPRLRAKSSSARCSSERHHPAGRIARRVDEDRARALVDRVEHALQVELPAAGRRALERHVFRHAAHQLHRRGDVRPDRRDDHHVVAGIDQHLAAEQDRLHAAGRDADAVDRALDAVEPLGVGAERGPQVRDAALPRIEGLARLQPLGRRVAHEVGRHEIALAEPQRHDVGIAEHGHGDIGDRRFGQSPDGAAQRGAKARRQKTIVGLHASDLAHCPAFRQPYASPTIVGGEAKPDLSRGNRSTYAGIVLGSATSVRAPTTNVEVGR